MINWWIYKKINGWKNGGYEYLLMANDYEIAKFNTDHDAILFKNSFNLKIDESKNYEK